MIASQQIGAEIDRISERIAEIEKSLSEIPAKCQREKTETRIAAQKSFDQKQQQKLASINHAIEKKHAEISQLLDTFPDLDSKEFAGRYEIKDLEDHLMEIYPPDLIRDYICLNPIQFSDDSEAYQTYGYVENMVARLKQGNFAGAVFNGLSALLDKAADFPQLGLKVIVIVAVLLIGGLFLSPFLFLTIFAVLGLVSGIHGLFVQRLLRGMYSVKLYLNNSYDEDIFARDKDDIMSSVEEYLDEAREQYEDIVASEEFSFDENTLKDIDKKYNLESQRLRSQQDLANQELQAKQQELEELLKSLDELSEREQKAAERARQEFLGKITWKKEWMQNVFLDVTSENKIKVMPFGKGNSLYYSRDIDNLKKLSRLTVFQSMLSMHPDFTANVILDYKYNGGELTQFVTVPERLCRICYSTDDLQKQGETISNKIRARTNTILGSCESIEEYNDLMATYNVSGEYYVVVHVFGLTSLSAQFLSNIRNGLRVGYFYKFYCTTEELIEMRDNFPLTDFMEIYEILDNPVPRMPSAVQRLFETGS